MSILYHQELLNLSELPQAAAFLRQTRGSEDFNAPLNVWWFNTEVRGVPSWDERKVQKEAGKDFWVSEASLDSANSQRGRWETALTWHQNSISRAVVFGGRPEKALAGLSFDQEEFPGLGNLVLAEWGRFFASLPKTAEKERVGQFLFLVESLVAQGVSLATYYEQLCHFILASCPNHWRFGTALQVFRQQSWQAHFRRVLATFQTSKGRQVYDQIVDQHGIHTLAQKEKKVPQVLPAFTLSKKKGHWVRRPSVFDDLSNQEVVLVPNATVLQAALRLKEPVVCGYSPYAYLVNQLGQALGWSLEPLYNVVTPPNVKLSLALWFLGEGIWQEAIAGCKIIEFSDTSPGKGF